MSRLFSCRENGGFTNVMGEQLHFIILAGRLPTHALFSKALGTTFVSDIAHVATTYFPMWLQQTQDMYYQNKHRKVPNGEPIPSVDTGTL